MTKTEIIAKFHLFMDDTTELSSQEESDLFDKIYNQVMAYRPWEISKTAFTGTILLANSVYYVTLPSDFSFLTQNANYSDNNNAASNPVVFIGSAYSPYPIVNFSDRRQYRTTTGFAYIDIANSKMIFTGTPNTGDAVEFDYYAVAAALTASQSPVFPSRFHDIIYHGMCADQFIIDQSDKAKSYRSENMARYNDLLDGMAYWNANLIQL